MTLRSLPGSLAGFSSTYPVALTLSNGGVPVLYLSYGKLQSLQLTLTNLSTYHLLLAPQLSHVSPAEYHFAFTFQPGVLDNKQLGELSLAEAGWELLAVPTTSGGTVLYVSRMGGQAFDPQDVILLNLQGITVAANASLSLTQLGLEFNLINVEPQAPLTGTRTAFLQMVPGSSGMGAPPLWLGFLGSNTVLNDGVTENALTLLLANSADTGSLTLNPASSNQPTTFLLRFATQPEGESRPWTLGNTSQIQAISIAPPDPNWIVEFDDTGDVPQWSITTTNASLPAGNSAHFSVTGVVSGMADGPASVSLEYMSLPNFADGQVTTVIEKGPIVVRTNRVGLGRINESSSSQLVVAGRVEASSFVLQDGRRLDPLPIGTILMWYGSATSIPTGWNLCNGTNNTPDLMGRFPIGAGPEYPLGTSGGKKEVILDVANLPSHTHSYQEFQTISVDWKSGGQPSWGNGTGGNQGRDTSGAGSGKAFNTLPPYTAVYFIIKYSYSGGE